MKEPGSTREKLFYAGVKIFAQKGFKESTVRDICKLANSSNINSINYYFGNKENLYKSILEYMFAEMEVRTKNEKQSKDSVENLKIQIRIACELMFSDHETGKDFVAIYINELCHPSTFLTDMVDTYFKPQVMNFMENIRQILGPEATGDQVRDCGLSVGGQIMYYCFMWPVVSRVYPEHPGMAAYREEIIEHITRFTLGGLNATKRYIKSGK